MIYGRLGEGSPRSAVTYMLLYIVKILLVLVPIAVALLLTVKGFGWEITGSSSGSSGAASTYGLRFGAPFVVLILLSAVAGYFHPGTRGRLAFRIILNVWLVVSLLIVAQGVEYAVTERVLSETYSITSQDLSVTVDVFWLIAPLLLIPVFSVIDAYLEWKGNPGVLSLFRRRREEGA